MCGRYTLISAPQAIRALFRYDELPNFPPRHNIAPTQPIMIVRVVGSRREAALVRWGLLPSWVKDPTGFALLINARGESVLDKPAFRAAMRRRRCLIPADGFYEWPRQGGAKRPHYIRRRSGAPMAFGGLWETWIGPNGEETETAAIVTTKANAALTPFHDRMPVILAPENFDAWLDPNIDGPEAMSLIAPMPNDELEIYPVSAAVNRVANDTPELSQPAHGAPEPPKPAKKQPKEKTDEGQASLF
jgi:putative SOS response-associated peptidase YedK